jgi:MFS family permease
MENQVNRGKLMIASFLTLVAAGMGFAARGAAGPAWAEMGIGPGDFGGIMGAGFLGFGFVILGGGVLVEMFGYKKLLILAIVLHFVSAVMLFLAPGMYDGWVEADAASATEKVQNLLYWSVFLFSVCAGLYEAVINPLVGQLYPENQTHYLNVLHAGWPGGLIVGGVLAAAFQNDTAWVSEIPWHYALCAYSGILIVLTVMVASEKFPETVSEGGKQSFDVLFSCFLSAPFLLLIVLHGLIGYMELGVDSWQTRLMENLVDNSVTVLIYTSMLMFVLRFFAGPIVHKINPIGLLLVSSVLAVLGLLWLGTEITSVAMIFAAATLYSFGKAFLWPTMLAVAGERYPQSGAVAMGALGASGMITVGFFGGAMIGAQQSEATCETLIAENKAAFERYDGGEETMKVVVVPIATYPKLDPGLQQAAMEGFKAQKIEDKDKQKEEVAKKLKAALEAVDKMKNLADDKKAERKTAIEENFSSDGKSVTAAFNAGGRTALTKTALIPMGMAIGFLILTLYFRRIGGYKVLGMDGQPIDGHASNVGEAASDGGDGGGESGETA